MVELASEDPARFAPGSTLYVDGEPAQVVAAKRAGGRPVLRLERAVARGQTLAVPRDALPPPEPDAYYVFQLVGLRVEDERGRALGRVADVVPGVANDVLELDDGHPLPLVEACVRDIDLDAGRIVVADDFAAPAS